MSTERGRRAGSWRTEGGAALVEFALILPIFLTLVLGLITFGQSYNRKLTMTNAVAEASRYGATLAPSTVGPVPPACCGIDQWVKEVAKAVVQNASGDLDAGVAGRSVCVAYVYPDAVLDDNPPTVERHGQVSHKLVLTTDDVGVSSSGTGQQCFADGRPNSERRVQVLVSRKSPLQALFFNYDLTLTARSVTRFEASTF